MSEFRESKLLAAAFVFASANGNKPGSRELSEVAKAGLQNTNPAQIARHIRDSLDDGPDRSSGYRSAAFWALGKRGDSELREFFRRHLAAEVNRDMEVA